MIISFVGTSDSGKTTLLTKVIPILVERGLKVAVVKHHSHGDFEIDKEGKDSWKLYQAGADVVISSPVKMAFIKRATNDDLDEIYERYLKGDYDLVLTEGFNKAGKDRIVIVRDPKDIEYFKHGKILAVVCDEKVEGYTWFRRDEVEKIAEFIIKLVKS
ncbi:molybdopterin-guanine dinucleotide biosynthesis protein B [Ferroglobus placidus DSM 10642]|uniref:Molybdopterin-guanine dinucleotide biosynthesis protein B n=1 Tax=Ferroglobus placidus (strain DSM 10642 / AEDII12DO) TaxID=589924 RepID=D3RX68_FERPA|nr:molybdopterin-guanine dinucleotide biosynthesis protein B [Ferroglobus placidus]ADC65081.1 molybdopterin-guanine dinucleotide biosynthesis protein B [Ferroglobus placidus DSM 10642]